MADFFIMPGALTSQLDAVNSLLSTLGQKPVATFDPAPTSDVTLALQRLNEVDLEVQGRDGVGWAWNREDQFPIALSGGHLVLPDETLGATLDTLAFAQDIGAKRIVQRGTMLYNATDHTFVFTSPAKINLVVRQKWDFLPQQARSYITLVACQRFHARKQQNQIVLQVNAEDVRRALVSLEHLEDMNDPQNGINNNGSVVSALYGNTGLRRNRGGN